MYGIDGPGDKLFRIKPSLGTVNFNFPNEPNLIKDMSNQNYEREEDTHVSFYLHI